jgi:hypothetical protein
VQREGPGVEGLGVARQDESGGDRAWSSPNGGFPFALNTGIRTKFTPAIDIDIMDPEVAEAVEELACETFGEHGVTPCRIGRPPKRALLLRTDEPFKKPVRLFIPTNGIYDPAKPPKIEILCDGQQIIAFSIHPDTRQHYIWPRGEPGQDQARGFALCARGRHGRVPRRDGKALGNDKDEGGGSADWGCLYANIIAGRDLHDSILALAGKMITDVKMDGGAVVNSIRGVMETSTAPHDERWQARYDGIPRTVAYVQEQEAAAKAAAKPEPEPRHAPQLDTNLLDAAHQTFLKWFGEKYDLDVLDVVTATCAAEKLSGGPPWLMAIAGSGTAKTETVQAANDCDGARVVSTLSSVGALLSGAPRKPGSNGGLLMEIGEHGTLVIKNFTSILSLDRNVRDAVLAALREIYDGYWSRDVGEDAAAGWNGTAGWWLSRPAPRLGIRRIRSLPSWATASSASAPTATRGAPRAARRPSGSGISGERSKSARSCRARLPMWSRTSIPTRLTISRRMNKTPSSTRPISSPWPAPPGVYLTNALRLL